MLYKYMRVSMCTNVDLLYLRVDLFPSLYEAPLLPTVICSGIELKVSFHFRA